LGINGAEYLSILMLAFYAVILPYTLHRWSWYHNDKHTVLQADAESSCNTSTVSGNSFQSNYCTRQARGIMGSILPTII